MSDTIPSDTHAVGDTGHPSDHNNMADMLGLLSQAVAQTLGTLNAPPAGNAANVTAIQSFVNGAGALPGTLDWINVLSSPYNADNSGVNDAAPAINSAITNAAPGQVVYLPAGTYLIKSPIVCITNGVTLQGDHGATGSGDDSGKNCGTYIKVSTSFTNPTYSSLATAAILIMEQPPAGGGNPTYGIRFRDFWITMGASPANVDGIAFYGSIKAVQCERVGVASGNGNGFAFYTGPATASLGSSPDGIHLYSCMVQGASGYGYYGYLTDGVLLDCHAQTCGNDGFYIQSGNTFMFGCRSDLNVGNGYTIDHRGGNNHFQDCIKLVCCGTQENQMNGLNVINDPPGTTISMPVLISSCDFGGDGTGAKSGSTYLGGSYAGINVQGANEVYVSNTSVGVYNDNYPSGSPKYAIQTQTPGVPNIIVVDGGCLNYSTVSGGALINDAAGVGNNLIIGPTVQQASGYAPSTFTLADPGPNTAVATKTSSYTLTMSDSTILLNGTTLTATLPSAVGLAARSFTIKLIAASTTGTVATTSSQTIDGATTYSLSARYKYVTVISDGANWQIIANN